MTDDKLVGYSLKVNYTRLVVYRFDSETKQLVCTLTYRSVKGVPKKERYKAMAEFMQHNGLQIPEYK